MNLNKTASSSKSVFPARRKRFRAVSHKNASYTILKRCFDLLFALLCSIVLLIPLSVLALLIVIQDPGSPFYCQERIGKGGKPFRLLKLRTMKKGSDDLASSLTAKQLQEYLQNFKLEDDPRLIGYRKPGDAKRCFSAVLRRMSLDELPQIVWNILIKGDMSFVGPRPILREELEKYYTSEEQQLLLSVKPGLTGYWQISARNRARYEDGARQKIELDYIQNRSLGLDLKILIRTIGAVWRKSGM